MNNLLPWWAHNARMTQLEALRALPAPIVEPDDALVAAIREGLRDVQAGHAREP